MMVLTEPVHPRPCGDRAHTGALQALGAGSSPPVRGSVLVALVWLAIRGFIPARAGIGFKKERRTAISTVHPRPCGDR